MSAPMMKLAALILCLSIAFGVQGLNFELAPKCVSTCWGNSQYVSACEQETDCLCNDTNFQSVVLQCLYSQCQTTQFGAALHQTLATCSNSDSHSPGVLPPLIGHQGLRRRQVSSGANSALAVHSAFVAQSASHSVFSRLTTASPLYGTGPTATVQASSLPTSSNATISYSPVQVSSANLAARLRIGL